MLNAGVMALLSGLAAQALKVVLELVRRRRWRPQAFFENGGMPSSHTATVTTLTLEVARGAGWGAPVTGLVLVFGVFVIFEATGLRQEMGHQAAVLNELMERARHGGGVDPSRLRELVGHTWTEVLGGLVAGAAFTLVWWRVAAGSWGG